MQSRITTAGACVVAALALAAPVGAQAPSGSGLTLPGGYESNFFYTGFTSPITALAMDSQGFVTACTISGLIRRLYDNDQDGVVEATQDVWPGTGLVSVTDILWSGSSVYVCHLGKITRIDDVDGDGAGDLATDVAVGITTGYHQNNGLLTDGPGHLLLTSGSATDLGPDPTADTATIQRVDLATGVLTPWCTGVRNAFGLVRHPTTGDVFGGDNEWNLHPSMALVGDEINRYVQGGVYGFPNYFGYPPVGSTDVPPTVVMPPRIAPTGLAFNPNTKISGYKDEIFVSLFSTNISRVARVPVWYGPASNYPAGTYEEFAQGFVNPIDVMFQADGAMLVADFSSKKIHRIYPVRNMTITVAAPPCIGTTVPLVASAPGHAGAWCYFAASEAATPKWTLAPGIDAYLRLPSFIFNMSITPGNGVFNFPVPGVINANGDAFASITLPNAPFLVGLKIYIAAGVFDPVTLAPLEATPEQGFLIIPYY
jgi:glucose/arabinose dehydrogenase